MEQNEMSQKTKTNLAVSLKSQLKKKSFNKITVKDIIEDCNVNRQTFYYHFHDLMDLAVWLFEQDAIQLMLKNDSCLTWEEGILSLLNYIEENELICRNILESLGRDMLFQFFQKDAQNLMTKLIYDISEEVNVSEDYLAFLRNFYIEAIAGMGIRWLREGMKTSPEMIIEFLRITMEEPIKNALIRAEQEHL